jgi:hypothetical protein
MKKYVFVRKSYNLVRFNNIGGAHDSLCYRSETSERSRCLRMLATCRAAVSCRLRLLSSRRYNSLTWNRGQTPGASSMLCARTTSRQSRIKVNAAVNFLQRQSLFSNKVYFFPFKQPSFTSLL